MSDRDNVIEELKELCEYLFHEYKVCYHGDEEDTYNRFLSANNALELLTEQKSEWLEDSDPGQEYGTTWACRKCMHSIHKPYVWNAYDSGYKYCPHCGAKMEVSGDAV